MASQPYPLQIDCVWIASDRVGHVGAFVTAGVGPIPVTTLKPNADLSVGDVEEAILKLPKVSGYRLLVNIPKLDSFIEMVERGIFVYDWSDVHRTKAESLQAYEPLVVPLDPISLDRLPDRLRAYAAGTKFETVAFAEGQLLNVEAYFESCAGR